MLAQLRLAAALAHGSAEAELELVGPGRRWTVSRRPCATLDPCGFRRLVLATARGCHVGLLPLERLNVGGGVQHLGGGVYESWGDGGPQRRIPTALAASAVEELLRALPDVDAGLTAHVAGDIELGTSVITMSSTHPVRDLRLDAIAQAVAARCMVEELLTTVGAASP